MSWLKDLFSVQQEITTTVEQLLDGSDMASGIVKETSPGQWEVVATAHHDHPVPLLPDSEVSIMQLISEYQRGQS